MNTLKVLNDHLDKGMQNKVIDFEYHFQEDTQTFCDICWLKLQSTGEDEYHWGYEMITYIKKYSDNQCELNRGILYLIEQYVRLYMKNNGKSVEGHTRSKIYEE